MPTKTPREPDRFEAKAGELARYVKAEQASDFVREVAAALRAAESSALERAADIADSYGCDYAARSIRALASPAAAPAAEPDPREDRWANPDLGPMPEFAPPSEPVAPADPFRALLVEARTELAAFVHEPRKPDELLARIDAALADGGEGKT